jgi:hypothetical protein
MRGKYCKTGFGCIDWQVVWINYWFKKSRLPAKIEKTNDEMDKL